MSWNYRVLREKTPDGYWYGVFSMYYDPMGHSEREAPVVGESLHELRECLKKFERAVAGARAGMGRGRGVSRGDGIMAWVLIIILVSNGNPSGLRVEFRSKEACEIARDEMLGRSPVQLRRLLSKTG